MKCLDVNCIKMKPVFVIYLTLLYSISISYAQNAFEGKVSTISSHNNYKLPKEDAKDVWYENSEAKYKKHEESLFDSCNLGYFHDNVHKIMTDETKAMLDQTGVLYGFYHSIYHVSKMDYRTRKESFENKNRYIAYLGIDLERLNTRVSYRADNRKYAMDFNVERKHKYVFFRLITNSWVDIDSINIKTEVQGMNLVVTGYYDRQILELTLSRRQGFIKSFMRIVGINNRQKSVFLRK